MIFKTRNQLCKFYIEKFERKIRNQSLKFCHGEKFERRFEK